MSALPKAIRRQVEEAERLEAQASAQQQQAVAEPRIEDVVANLSATEATPVVPAAPAPAPVQEPQEDFRQKYLSLKGMFDSMVPNLQKQLAQSESKTADFASQVAALRAEMEKLKTPATKPAEAVDPKDVQEFGLEMVEMAQRAAERVLAQWGAQINAKFDSVDKRVADIEAALKGIGQQTAATAGQTFEARLSALVPNWEQINVDSRWLQWLAETDPVFMRPRQVALDEAAAALDPEKAAKIFNAFLATLPATPTTPAPSALEAQVTPSSGGSPVSVQAAKPVFSSKQIEAFYADMARGRYRGREVEAAAIEAEINRAIAEGRVTTR